MPKIGFVPWIWCTARCTAWNGASGISRARIRRSRRDRSIPQAGRGIGVFPKIEFLGDWSNTRPATPTPSPCKLATAPLSGICVGSAGFQQRLRQTPLTQALRLYQNLISRISEVWRVPLRSLFNSWPPLGFFGAQLRFLFIVLCGLMKPFWCVS